MIRISTQIKSQEDLIEQTELFESLANVVSEKILGSAFKTPGTSFQIVTLSAFKQ